MSAESPRMVRSGGTEGALTVPAVPPPDRSLINTVSGFISDVKLTSNPPQDPKDVIQWARFETVDINEPLPEGEQDLDLSPVILVLGYGQGVQVWSVTPNGNAKEVLSWRQGVVKVLRILPTAIGTDFFAHKRPLIALCDSSSPGTQFCSLSFISLRNGDQVKSIKFKNPILDVLSNKRSVVVSFSERFAVFDAGTLEDRMTVTTCYPCPCPLGGSNPINPLALGDRWLAYADKKLIPSKRSSGGCEGDGVSSYTASVLHAAKSLSKGLRGFSESVAHSLAGTKTALSQSPSPPTGEHHQPGVVTILDIENPSEEDLQECEEPYDPIVAHFIAHSDAIIAMKFDASGMLLVTADKRGHDFHVFRIHPHPFSSALAAVHHLYALHRGDTTAKVQDIAISLDSRWVSVSTLRGTTHLFPINPYGGATNTRTHTHPRVVNRLSRFQRSAGLPLDRPHSPVCDGLSNGWFPNPRLPPYPAPIQTPALAHLRATQIPTNTITRTSSGRQRLSSTSEDSGVLLARAAWAPNCQAASVRWAVYSLYVLGAGGQLTHYRMQPKPSSGVSREKICEDTVIEVECEATCAWSVCSRPTRDLPPPLANDSPLLARRGYSYPCDASLTEEERWLSQVEIVTHAGPHRRLWMGPQFVFKTYNTNMGSAQSLIEEVDLQGARTPPVSVPARPHPLLLDSGSTSSLEHSPSEVYRKKSIEAAGRGLFNDVQLKEDLAEAMKETEGRVRSRRVSDLMICASNTDEESFRCVRCAPAEPPAPLPSARSLSPISRQLPASQAPIAPSPPPAAAALSATLRLPAALIADEPKQFQATLPSFHDPDSKFKIPQALLPSAWPQLEVPNPASKTLQNECSQQDGIIDNLIADASVNVDLNTENNCLNSKEHFDIIDLRNESNDFYEKPGIDLLPNVKDDPVEEDFEIESILNVTLHLRPKETTPLQEATVESKPLLIEEHFENNELEICKEVECLKLEPKIEIQKVKTKRSKKSKGKQTENKLKTNEPKFDLDNQIRKHEETLVDINIEDSVEQSVTVENIEPDVIKDNDESINNKLRVKKENFEKEESIQLNTENNASDCIAGKKTVEKMHKVKSWATFSKQSSPAPETKVKSRTVSPPAKTWSAIASGTSKGQQDIEELHLDDVKKNDNNELKDSKRYLDDGHARPEWPQIEKKKKERMKKNNIVENFKIKTDSEADDFESVEGNEVTIEVWAKKELMETSVEQLETGTIHISEQLIKMVSETSEHEVTEIEKNEVNRFKRKKGKSKTKKTETPIENSSDSDVGVIDEGMFLPVQENLINEEIVSLTAKLEEIYNLKDVLVAQCVDPLEIIIQNDVVDDKSDENKNELLNFGNDDFDDCDFFAQRNEESNSNQDALSEGEVVAEGETLENEVVLKPVELVPVTVSQVANLMEKSSDDDNTSPIVSSQTDSDDKEERKTNEVIITVPPPKPMANKKKSKKKRR